MNIDASAARQFLAYVDGERSLASVWKHPAYEIVRTHAELLGRDLSREDVAKAVAGEQTALSNVENLAENRTDIEQLIAHVRSVNTEWSEQIRRQLERVVPDEDVSDVPIFLGIGGSLGIGLETGAYLNLNEPLFLQQPRQVCYTAIHESSHVVYERVHGVTAEVTDEDFESREGQQRIFRAVFQTEAYATYMPLRLIREEGAGGEYDHPICEDYRVLGDESRMRELVAEFDSFRETLRDGPVPRETLLRGLFGGSRLPYRVGCAMLAGLEEKDGLDAVQDGFYLEPATFIEEYDRVLDEYRRYS